MAGVEEVKQQLSALSVEDRRRAIADLDLADRIIVQSTSSPRPRKLRLFSGRSPIPSGEVDFETWRLLVRQLEDDGHISDADTKLVILQNLLRPALDAVKAIGPLSEVLDVLDNLYGSVVDGQELLIRFHTTYQEEKESASEYVQRIYLLVIESSEKGGAILGDVPKLLLSQFIRGCRDEALIAKLKLEEKVGAPPSFAVLLLSIRREESKMVEKRLRLKAAGRVSTVAVVEDPTSGQIKQLQDQVSQLSAQLQQHMSQPKVPYSKSEKVKGAASQASGADSGRGRRPSHRGRQKFPIFCYRCGLDGHSMDKCREAKNPTLVQEKLELRWKAQQVKD